MKHHIIVKYNEKVTDKNAMNDEVEKLFSGLPEEVEGVHGVTCFRNCIDRSNRYDLMIRIDIEKEKLSVYDDCRIHHFWKDNYAHLLEKKCIFDYED